MLGVFREKKWCAILELNTSDDSSGVASANQFGESRVQRLPEERLRNPLNWIRSRNWRNVKSSPVRCTRPPFRGSHAESVFGGFYSLGAPTFSLFVYLVIKCFYWFHYENTQSTFWNVQPICAFPSGVFTGFVEVENSLASKTFWSSISMFVQARCFVFKRA